MDTRKNKLDKEIRRLIWRIQQEASPIGLDCGITSILVLAFKLEDLFDEYSLLAE